MKKKMIAILVLLFCGAVAYGQYTPPPAAAYSFTTGSWMPLTGTGGTPISYTPPAFSLYCYNGTGWVPWTSAVCAPGGTGTFNALTGDATSTATGGATTVVGINGILLSSLATGPLCNTTTTGVPSACGVTGTGNVAQAAGASLTNPSITPQQIDCHTACSPTAAQLSNAQASNYGQTTANVSITGPTVAAGMNFIMIVGTAQASNYWRYSSTTANIYLDGSGTAVTNIIFAAPAVGNSFSCFSFQIGSSTYALKCTTLAGVSTSS